jgi:hypothetical protein
MSAMPTDVVEVKHGHFRGGCLEIPPLWVLLDKSVWGKDMEETPKGVGKLTTCECE